MKQRRGNDDDDEEEEEEEEGVDDQGVDDQREESAQAGDFDSQLTSASGEGGKKRKVIDYKSLAAPFSPFTRMGYDIRQTFHQSN